MRIAPQLRDKSRLVSSNQPHLNPRLGEVVQRHLRSEHRKPPAPHNLAAYDELRERLEWEPRPLVLDSFCGTGYSTALLARRHPEHLVVGVDKSEQRLARQPGAPAQNSLLLRADCEDVWYLLARDRVPVDYHYLFYPNPWPKSRHLQRRVHGHASFPLLLRLARDGQPGRLELRSNWQLYLEEFGSALHIAGHPGVLRRISGDPEISLFERKYRDSGHDLWQFEADCGRTTTRA